MKVEVITIGDELTTGTIQDTNFTWLSEQLSLNGFDVIWNQIVRDQAEDIQRALLASLGRSHAVIVTGGLGPTIDDITTEIVARTFGLELSLHEESLQKIRRFVESRGRTFSESQKKQAMLPSGALLLPNKLGTAPGYFLKVKETTFFCLPGVPQEMKQQFCDGVLPELKKLIGPSHFYDHRVLRCFGLAEAEINECLKSHDFGPLRLSYRVSFPEIILKLVRKGNDSTSVQRGLDQAEAYIRQALGEKIFATGEETIEQVVGRLLKAQKATIALAESCTGGLMTHMLTNVSGSSAYVDRGCVVYSNRSKQDILGISPDILKEHGAVSGVVAKEMAVQVRRLAQTTYGLAVTGIAGPTGGTKDKPIGTVHIALATPMEVREKGYHFPLSREMFKIIVAHVALHKLRRELLRRAPGEM